MLDNMFSLGKKSYKSAFHKEYFPMDSSLYTNIKQKEGIGKPYNAKIFPKLLERKENKNDVRQHRRRARSGGAVAPAKKGAKKY